VDVGDVSLEVDGEITRLLPRQVPDVTDVVSGIVYARGTFRPRSGGAGDVPSGPSLLPPATRYIVHVAGGHDLGAFDVAMMAPRDPSEVRIAGETAQALELGSSDGVAFSWTPDGPDDLVYVDVRPESASLRSTTQPSADVPSRSTTPPSADVPLRSTTQPSADVPSRSTTQPSADVPSRSTTQPSADVPSRSTTPPPADVPSAPAERAPNEAVRCVLDDAGHGVVSSLFFEDAGTLIVHRVHRERLRARGISGEVRVDFARSLPYARQ
jgi:hypothetical protein